MTGAKFDPDVLFVFVLLVVLDGRGKFPQFVDVVLHLPFSKHENVSRFPDLHSSVTIAPYCVSSATIPGGWPQSITSVNMHMEYN